MKLSFETQGFDSFSWEDALALAKENGFGGVSFAYTPSFSQRFAHGPDASRRRRDLELRCREAGLDIPCLSTGALFSQAPADPQALSQLQDAVSLAGILSIPYVALQAQAQQAPDDLLPVLEQLLPLAAAQDVTLLLETSGPFGDTSALRSLLNGFASDHLAALWNIAGPVGAGETPGKTIENLGAYVKHAYIQDRQDGQPRLTGDGEYPLQDVMLALRSIDYKGYLSLVWPPQMWEELGLDVALPHFANYMQRFLGAGRDGTRLYSNRAGTGYFPWPKDRLIPLTFSQMLDRVTDIFPDQYAFRYTTLDYTRTYSEFRADVDTFARSLIALGVKAGDHVAVWATNVPQWYIAFWATVKLGAVLVTMNTAYKIHEAEYLLRQSDTHTLVLIDGYREVSYVDIMKELCPELTGFPADVEQQAELSVKYEGYLKKQQAQVARARAMEDWRIPEDIDYDCIESLRIEARQKLKAKKPLSLSQAGRIPGVNPADVAVLMVWLKRRRDAVEANDTREREQP